jgi:muramoyltetrapeptide carboxypeptidase
MSKRVGVSSFASPVAHDRPKRTERALANVRRIGWEPVEGSCLRTRRGFQSGSALERIEDLHGFLRDGTIDVIMSAIGGFGCLQLIDKIDYALIQQQWKPIVGYSDFTIVLNSIYKAAGRETYLGPSLLPQFGEPDGLDPFACGSVMKALSGQSYELEDADYYVDQLTAWDIDDVAPREKKPNPGRRVLFSGSGEGTAIGGNLDSLCALIGTDYYPDVEKPVLFLEEFETVDPRMVERNLFKLRLSGKLDRTQALLFGRFASHVRFDQLDSLERIIDKVAGDLKIPVVIDLSFGHTDPICTIPIGRHVSVRDGRIAFTGRAQ